MEWGTLAEWANAVAVVVAACVAVVTVRGIHRQRAAERQSDLAVSLLEAIYRFESEVQQIRSVGEILAAFDAAKPYRSEFEVSLQKLNAYERRIEPLKTTFEKLIELLPSVRAVFGDIICNAAAIVANVYRRIEAARYGIRQYNSFGRDMATLGEPFSGWDLGETVINESSVRYYWATLIDDDTDTAQVRKQIAMAKAEIERRLFPIVREPFNEGSKWKLIRRRDR